MPRSSSAATGRRWPRSPSGSSAAARWADPTDAQGRDQKLATIPKEIAGLAVAVNARDHHVFFGAYSRDRKKIGLAERLMSLMLAATDAIPDGDFRDWSEIEAWASGIARDLRATPPA
jgi:menaquinone-dependent protoporphyrinogen oxidase